MTTTIITQLNKICREAGKKILEIYADESRFDTVEWKSNDSPLTLADKAAHNYIVEQLQPLTPDIPILSEEGKEISWETRKEWTRLWLVDPLDGTKEFIKRNGEFTVNVALIEEGKPVMGCVHVPVWDTTYFAVKGSGAWCQKGDEEPVRIQANTYSESDSGLKLVVSRSHLSPEVEAFVSKFDNPEPISMGSSLKFLLVAEGKADIYPRLAPTMEWDTGAAHIIVEEAGGSVLRDDNGEALSYNKENLLNPWFIAYGNRNPKP